MDSGLKLNAHSGVKVNTRSPNPGMSVQHARNGKSAKAGRWTSNRHNESSKGGSTCRPGESPCGRSGRYYASVTN